MEALESGAESGLVEHQLKYCSQMLTRMKRNANASPFLEPVDPVKLGIPDYPLKIKQPMDLSTIRKKLDVKEYKHVKEFDADMRLMFQNCYVYNPAGTVVHEMGKALEGMYDELMAGMPNEVGRKRKRSEVPATGRAKHMKRSARVSEGMRVEEYDLCNEVIAELMKGKHKAYNWPFLEPVDEGLVPGYYSVISEPMDLQTIHSKLEQKKYHGIEEFKNDLELIVENCKKFNAPGTEVYECGVEFEKEIAVQMQRVMPNDVRGKIAELKKKIAGYTREIKMLEARMTEQDWEGSSMKTYSLSERVSIGNAILNMNRNQTEEVAKIVLRHGSGEFVENDEIEVDMRTIPDHVVEEIDMYINGAEGEASDTLKSD
ncbi:bromodomain-containingprotein [Ordospora pajunii]|uniref:bromodomain-containingprotein n=1 Tax=Ordospora pajunii TaxID=3039483 RepID=UPI0029528822|nr:bromodomain-containingprotein [Ordospora pajunii]KAH9410888.1 bromodomain-containingprotein [Ordospora pajunii]